MTDAPVRERLLDATVTCVDRSGLRRFSMEDVATEAGVGRATLYRHFPGGRDQLVSEAVTREVAQFWRHLAAHVGHLDGLEDRLVEGLMEARRQLVGNELLQRLLAAEPDDLLPRLAESGSLVHLVMTGYLRDLLAREAIRAGVDLDEAAGYLTRMLLSHVSSPGRWDLTERDEVRRLVRRQFLAGILE